MEYLERMSIPTTWIGVPELKLVADLLGRIIVVLSHRQVEKLSSEVYDDVYLPIERSGHQPPLFIKSTPKHFQESLIDGTYIYELDIIYFQPQNCLCKIFLVDIIKS